MLIPAYYVTCIMINLIAVKRSDIAIPMHAHSWSIFNAEV